MAGVNRVMLIGHVGRDAEVRYTQSGRAVANFSLATSERYTARDSGEVQEKTEWHNIVCWGRQAEIAGQYVKKGKQLYVEGRLETRNWVDPQGVKHYKTEINCRNFQFLGRKDEMAESEYSASGAGVAAPGGKPAVDEYDIGDLGPPLDMDDKPLSPGD
ncbi:single-stranded DNA-binding protein [bacterium]|nr:single-stranded DNA-binding protein [bacterium]